MFFSSHLTPLTSPSMWYCSEKFILAKQIKDNICFSVIYETSLVYLNLIQLNLSQSWKKICNFLSTLMMIKTLNY
jgi:hypothetical protein